MTTLTLTKAQELKVKQKAWQLILDEITDKQSALRIEEGAARTQLQRIENALYLEMKG